MSKIKTGYTQAVVIGTFAKHPLWGIVVAAVSGIAAPAPAAAVTFNYTGLLDTYIVPTTGVYTIDAAGAQAGNSGSNVGGKGGQLKGNFNLTAGQILKILVGGAGGNGGLGTGVGNAASGGGGGGTFVATSIDNTPTILLSAGGGGNGSFDSGFGGGGGGNGGFGGFGGSSLIVGSGNFDLFGGRGGDGGFGGGFGGGGGSGAIGNVGGDGGFGIGVINGNIALVSGGRGGDVNTTGVGRGGSGGSGSIGIGINGSGGVGGFGDSISVGGIYNVSVIAGSVVSTNAVRSGNGILSIDLVSSATAVPEPFTLVGTLIGGTAALRLRQRLKAGGKQRQRK